MRTSVLSIVLLSLASCTSPTASTADLAQEASATAHEEYCRCRDRFDAAVASACEEDLRRPIWTDAQTACFAQVEAAHPTETAPVFACVVAASERATACLGANDTCDTSAITACVTGWQEDLDACPVPDPAIAAELGACLE